jgi:tRNA(Ile)-lysidine synthetase-like protein
MEILRAESEFISGAVEAPVGPFGTLPIAIQRRILNAQLCSMGIEGSFDLIESLRLHPDTPISVGPEKAVRRDNSGKVVVCGTLAVAFCGEKAKADLTPKRGEIEFGGLSISWDRSQKRGSTNGEAFDADRVGPRATLRHWQPGDRFQPIGMPSAVKLQDLFTNLKIPRETRRQLVVAASATGELFWVEGCRMSENHKLTAATRKVLHWKWKRLLPIPNVVNADLSKADE